MTSSYGLAEPALAPHIVPHAIPQQDQRRPCVACGSEGPHASFLIPGDFVPDDRDLFPYFACVACGTLQISEVPEDLARYYGQTYYSMRGRQGGNPLRGLIMGLRNAYAARGRGPLGGLLYKLWPHPQLTMLRPALDGHVGPRRDKSVRLLDVGCGSGQMLRELRGAGFSNLTGIDPFLAHPTDEPGFRLIGDEVLRHQGTYDIITFNHSLEHVVDPVAALAAARRLLAPNGVIIVRVPLVDSEAWRIYGGEWGQLDAPRHLYLFTRKGLASLASSAGCKVAHAQDDSTETQFVLSELRLRGIRFHEVDVKAMSATTFTPEQIGDYKRRAAAFNADGVGDQAAFYLTERAAA